MAQSIDCQKCNQAFDPLSTAFADMVRRFANGGQDDLGIECPHCNKYTNFNPTAFMDGRTATTIAAPYRCPVTCCAGSLSLVDDGSDNGPFWGCGECGSLWYDKNKLLAEITKIVKRFSYRKTCYRKSKGEWIPADPGKEVEDYEDRVCEEPEDESDDYVRG